MNGLATCIPRRWIRAPEDDRAGVLRYRAEDGGLPLSRLPRAVLELLPSGRATHLVPGPADARVARTGSWAASGDREVRFTWDDGGPETVVDVLECTPTVLGISVRSGSLEPAPPARPANGPAADRGTTSDPSACLPGRWLRAPQDDAREEVRYRIAEAARPTLELTAAGRLLARGAQRIIPRPGRWAVSGSAVTVRWDDGGPETVFDVVRCTGAELGIRITSGSLP